MRPPPGILCPALRFEIQLRYGPARAGPEECYENYQMSGTLVLCRRLRVRPVQPGEEKASGRTCWGFSILTEDHIKAEKDFTKTCSDRTKGNGFKQKGGRFRLDIRKSFFTRRVVRHWNKLSGEVVNVPLLEVFQDRLDGALGKLIRWKTSLPMAGGLELDDISRFLPTLTILWSNDSMVRWFDVYPGLTKEKKNKTKKHWVSESHLIWRFVNLFLMMSWICDAEDKSCFPNWQYLSIYKDQ